MPMHRQQTAALVSDEPLILAIHQHVLELMLAAFTLGLVYTCLVPFDFRGMAAVASGHNWQLGLRADSFNTADILANITIYIPIGLMVCGAARRRGRHRLRAGVTSVAYGTLLSVGIEYGQNFVHSRVGSWVDVTANCVGTAIGVMLMLAFEPWLRIAARHATEEARRNWRLAVCKVFIALVLVVLLRPYDVVVDVTQTAAAAWRKADFHPFARLGVYEQEMERAVTQAETTTVEALHREKAEYLLDRVVDVAVYSAVSALVILGLARERRRIAVLWLWAGGVTCALAVTVVFVRIFLMSHGFDATHFYCSLLGWPLGCMAATIITWNERRPHADVSTLATGRQTAIAICCLLLVGLYDAVPFDFDPQASLLRSRVCLVPFMAHFASDANVAIADISGDLLRYGICGAAWAVLIMRFARFHWRLQVVMVVLLNMLAAAIGETVHLWMPSRQADITTILMAGAGGLMGAIAVRWVQDVRASLAIVEVDDLLTRQLIDGETYQPIVIEQPARPRAGASRTGLAQSDPPI